MLDTINNAITAALKSGDKPTAEALRLLKSSFINARISLGHELSDAEAIKIIQKEIKSRIEARDMYEANNRPELAEKEEFERTVYTAYVPKALTESEIDTIITAQAAMVDGEVTFAALMPKVMQAVAGKADGKIVAEQVKQFIGKAN